MRSLAITVVTVAVVATDTTACSTARGTPTEVVAMSTAPASGPKEPRVSAMGSDLSDLPSQYPDGDWLPIDSPLLSMAVLVQVKVNGTRVSATLDTGAMGTTMSTPMAEKLGILGEDDDPPRGRAIRAVDAHGDVVMGRKLSLGELDVGRHKFPGVEVTVLGDQPDLFLVGADVLQSLDIYIAADEGLVGLFDAGRGPVNGGDRRVSLEKSERQLTVHATAKGMRSGVEFPLIVDTGAWNTSVPLLIGINSGLPADIGYGTTTIAIGGEQENRGRFVLDPMQLGPERTSVGRVLAIGSTMDDDGGGGSSTAGGIGLLGNDVMMRQHTLISFNRGALWLKPVPARPTTRSRGPGGALCKGSCVSVAIVAHGDDTFDATDLPNACLKIDVDKAFSGKTIELAITGASNEVMNGGAIRAFMTANDGGAHACFHLWRQLDHLGITTSTPLSLRWVRTEGVQWPCDPMKTRCITFTGPLAKLPVK